MFILIVERDTVVRQDIEETVSRLDVDIRIGAVSELEFEISSRADIVITDRLLPEAHDALLADQNTPLIYTIDIREMDISCARRTWLSRPFSQDRLCATVRDAIKFRNAQIAR